MEETYNPLFGSNQYAGKLHIGRGVYPMYQNGIDYWTNQSGNEFDFFGIDSAAKSRNEMRNQLALAGAQRELDESWFQSHESFSARFQDMVKAGVPATIAMRSLTGQGSMTPSASQSIPSANQQPMALDSLNGLFNAGTNYYSAIVDSKMKQAEIENLGQQTIKLGIENGFLPEILGKGLKLTQSEIDNRLAGIKNLDADTKLKLQDYDYHQSIYPWQVEQVKQSALLISQEVQTEIQRTKLTSSEIRRSDSQTRNIDADSALLGAQKGLVEEQTGLVRQQARIASYEANMALRKDAFEKFVNGSVPLDAGQFGYYWSLMQRGQYVKAENFLEALIDMQTVPFSADVKNRKDYPGQWFFNKFGDKGVSMLRDAGMLFMLRGAGKGAIGKSYWNPSVSSSTYPARYGF